MFRLVIGVGIIAAIITDAAAIRDLVAHILQVRITVSGIRTNFHFSPGIVLGIGIVFSIL